MWWIALIALCSVLAIVAYIYRPSVGVSLSHLPEHFIVFDLETTGLDPRTHEIVEIGAIRFHRDSKHHDTFQAFVKTTIPVKISQLTGIAQTTLDKEGEELGAVLRQFLDFVGDLRLVSFNARFDTAFLERASERHGLCVTNPVSCALQMARRAWPGRTSYRLADLARDGNLSSAGTHRALGDCRRALIVYTAAASRLGTIQ